MLRLMSRNRCVDTSSHVSNHCSRIPTLHVAVFHVNFVESRRACLSDMPACQVRYQRSLCHSAAGQLHHAYSFG